MTITLAATALLLAAVAPSTTGTPSPARLAPAALPDTVRGVVFDSLTNTPLAAAFVFAEPGGASVTSDSLGRFTLVSDARVTRLTVYHDALDEIGIGALVVARPDEVARWTDVTVATPSLASVWASVCRAELPAEEGSRGVLVGSVRLPDDRTRVAGATVAVQWDAILPRTRLTQRETRSAVTDSTGAYAVCGLPAPGEVAMAGTSVEYASGAVQLAIGARALRRIDLVLAPADGPVTRWPTLVGRVIGPDQQPVPNATVALDGVDSAIVTGADGRFAIPQAPPGSRMLAAVADGFVGVAQQVDVLYDGTPEVLVPLERALAIAGLEGLVVTERRVLRRDREEFEARRQDAIARFVDTAQIREAGSLRAALEQVPGLVVQDLPGSEDPSRFVLAGRPRSFSVGTCGARILVDGVPATLEELHTIPTAELAAVEVYRDVSFAPARFQQWVINECALVAFWTLYGLRP